MSSYVNDGTEYTRGVGAVASLDLGSQGSASAATMVPTSRGMVELVRAKPTLPLVYGKTVPYPKWPAATGAVFETPGFGVTLKPLPALEQIQTEPQAQELPKPLPKSILIGGVIMAGIALWVVFK